MSEAEVPWWRQPPPGWLPEPEPTTKAEKIRAWALLRKARIKQATPPWVNPKQIAAVYRLARKRTIETGVPHEVDHIVPIAAPDVCGLHVPWNLRVVPGWFNRRKFLSYDPNGKLCPKPPRRQRKVK